MPHPAWIPPLLVLSGFSQGAAPLHPGDTAVGEITAAATAVHTEALDSCPGEAPALGLAYTLKIDAPGPITIELRSDFFDAYLVLESEDGTLVAEDDDGLLRAHARIAQRLEPGRYTVRACALRSGEGSFTLEVRSRSRAPREARPRLRTQGKRWRPALLGGVRALGRVALRDDQRGSTETLRQDLSRASPTFLPDSRKRALAEQRNSD